MWNPLSLGKACMLLEDLKDEIRKFERGKIEEVNLDVYLDEISRYVAKIILEALIGNDKELKTLMEKIQEDHAIESSTYQIINDAFTLNLSIVSNITISNKDTAKSGYKISLRNLLNEKIFRDIVYRTVSLAEGGDVFSSILLASKIFNFGIISILKEDLRGLGRVLDYYTILTIRLYDPNDILRAPLKFSLYISHLILMHMAMFRGGLIENMEQYRSTVRGKTKIASMINKAVKSNEVARISMAIRRANRLAAHLALNSLMYMSDWRLIRELNELYWMMSNLRSKRNLEELQALQNNLEAVIHVINSSEMDMKLAQDVMEKKVMIGTEDDRREASVGLTASAIKLWMLGLEKRSRKVEEFMARLSKKREMGDFYRFNLDFLRHLRKVTEEQ
ncbi:MAG: hypothetical protein ACE5GD_07250 [Candidatus Geothermarchaeales archaeon]